MNNTTAAGSTDAFFGEMIRAAKSKARRDIAIEQKTLRAENVKLRGRVTKLLKAEKTLATRDAQLLAREKEVDLAVSEIQYISGKIEKLRQMSIKSFLTGSVSGYYGGRSTKAKALAKLAKAKK